MKATLSITLRVSPAPITADSPENIGVVGSALPDGAALALKGGTPPFQITGVSGQVPGVDINTDGSLTGTPTQAGDFTVVVQVADSTESASTTTPASAPTPAPQS